MAELPPGPCTGNGVSSHPCCRWDQRLLGKAPLTELNQLIRISNHAEEAAATKAAGPRGIQVRPLCLSYVISRHSLVIHLVEFLLVYLRGLADVNQWHGWSDHSQMIVCLWALTETKLSAWVKQGKEKKNILYQLCFGYCSAWVTFQSWLGRSGCIFGRRWVFYFGQRASIKSQNTDGKK